MCTAKKGRALAATLVVLIGAGAARAGTWNIDTEADHQCLVGEDLDDETELYRFTLFHGDALHESSSAGRGFVRDACDEGGTRVVDGMYFARAAAGGESAVARAGVVRPR